MDKIVSIEQENRNQHTNNKTHSRDRRSPNRLPV